jgi:CBS domain-containing protein
MKVGELMKRSFETVHPDATIDDVAPLLARHERIPVCEHGRLLGMLRRANLEGVTAEPGRARRRRIRDLIAPDIAFCLDSTDVDEARVLMREKDLPWLPVVDGRHVLVGLVFAADVESPSAAPDAQGTAEPARS